MRFLQMTPDEFQEAKLHFDMTAKTMRETFGVARSTVALWEKNGPPQAVAMFLRLAHSEGLAPDDAIERCAGPETKKGPPGLNLGGLFHDLSPGRR
jgi:DNA-binding XRE family transcriptional regulator